MIQQYGSCPAIQAAFKKMPSSGNSEASGDLDWSAVKAEDKYLMHQVPLRIDSSSQLMSCMMHLWLRIYGFAYLQPLALVALWMLGVSTWIKCPNLGFESDQQAWICFDAEMQCCLASHIISDHLCLFFSISSWQLMHLTGICDILFAWLSHTAIRIGLHQLRLEYHPATACRLIS